MERIANQSTLDGSTATTTVHMPRRKDMRQWAKSLGVDAALSIRTDFGFVPKRRSAGSIDVIDLFSGCGGLSAGFEYVGRLTSSYRLIGAVDCNQHSNATYAANLSIEPQNFDLSAVVESDDAAATIVKLCNVRPRRPLILIGGPPCQGFSSHQKRHGSPKDKRNSLLASFGRFAVLTQPDFIAFENVPELLTKKYWRHFRQLVGVLESAGYIVRAQVHDLAGFGVPQHRFRAVVLASLRPFKMPKPFLGKDEVLTVRDAIGQLPPVNPGQEVTDDSMHYCTRHRKSTIQTIRHVPLDGGRRPKGIGPDCLDRVDGFRDVYGRMFWDRPSNTITGYARNPASGRFIHPEQHRGLTIREAALLQAFPQRFAFEGPFDDKFWQIGNAVPPAFAAYLAAHVLGEIKSSTSITMNREDDVQSAIQKSFASSIPGLKNGVRSESK